jgi:hypothetical protein
MLADDVADQRERPTSVLLDQPSGVDDIALRDAGGCHAGAFGGIAVARPMPVPAPVTKATLPSKRTLMGSP